MAVVNGQMGIHTRQEHITFGFACDKIGFALVNTEGVSLTSGISASTFLAGRDVFSSWLIEGTLESLTDSLLSEETLIFSFYPGRDKIGFAFVNDSGVLLASGIFPSNEAEKFLSTLLAGHDVLSLWLIEGSLEFLTDNLLYEETLIYGGD